MRKFYSYLLPFLIVFFGSFTLNAQKSFFFDASERTFKGDKSNRVIVPQKYRPAALDLQSMKSFLWSLKDLKQLPNRNAAPVLELPRPDGTTATFRVWESSIQEPGLEAKFPEIKTFSGQGIDDPYATIRFDLTPRGFHAQVLTINGTYYIDPYSLGNTTEYISYYRHDHMKSQAWTCDVQDVAGKPGDGVDNFTTASCRGTEMRTYRLAVATTGEYAQAPGISAGNNPALLHAAVVTTMNRVIGVYEKEVAVSMVLIANNNVIEYLDAASDPFNGNDDANTLINESQSVISANIGSANYDIGHTFSTGGGGLAQLNSPCGPSKARGITGSPFPTGDAYDIDYVAHEMGHQYGGNHSMNGCGASPNTTKYEVGSGTTIQAYAGICGAQNIQPNSDPHFHGISFDEISNFIMTAGGATCGVTSPTSNTLPVVGAITGNSSIPPGTPFTLTGTATDADGDALSYNWEQWDLGLPGQGWNVGATAPAGNTAPLFKSRIPKTTGSRTFPDVAVINAGFPANPPSAMNGLKGETLSPVARPMKFRLTVRDNRAAGGGVVSVGGGGCQNSTPVTITVVGTSPFTVAVPNGGESYPGNTSQTVTWNVVGTNAAPVNVADVKISLSTDGGLTYPTVLAASTPNDGSESVVIPNTATTTAKIKVEAIGNVFFDVSNANWTITAATSGFIFTAPAAATVVCGGAATASTTLATVSSGGFVIPINLTAAGAPAGTTVSFGTNPVTPGNSSSVTLNNVNTLIPGTYTVTVTGTAGAVVQTQAVQFIVTAGASPTFTTQPASQAICAGDNVTFTAAATGVTYQWQVSTAGAGGPFTNISGATSASYTITGATTAQNGNIYHVVISTLCGTATSSNATLTVNAGPAITAQPVNATTCSGQNVTYSVTATGGGLSYQWQSAPSCAGPWTNIAGATSASYTASAVTNAMDGFGYRVIVTGACPSPVTSNCATLTVGNTAAITGQPVNAIVCVGSNASFTVTTTGTVTYQWQVSTNGGTSFSDIAGATSATLALTSVTAAQNNNQYHVVVFNCTGTSIISNNAVLTVNTPVTITTQPEAVTLCSGNNATFTVAATGSSLTYQWQESTNGGTTFTNIAGATSATLTLPATAAMSGNQYHVIVTGPCNAGGVTSSNVILTVNSPVTISAQPESIAVCLPLPGGTTFSVTAAGTGLTYQWQVSSNGGAFTNIAGATGSTLNVVPTAATNGNQYQVVLNGTCTSNLVSSAAILTVNAPVQIDNQPLSLSQCTGDDVLMQVTASSATPGLITYQWQVSVNGGPFANIPGATNRTLLLSNVTGSMNGNVYRVIVSGPPCGSVTSANATLTVNERPGVVLAASEYTNINPGVPSKLYATVSPSGPSYSYLWYRDGVFVPNLTGNQVTLNVDILGTYTVEVINDATGCGRLSNSVTISDSAAAANVIFIYPNPTSGQFQVRYYTRDLTTTATTHTLSVYDSKGARVFQKVYPIGRVYERMDVNLVNASAGIYMVELNDSKGKRLATGRVIVSR